MRNEGDEATAGLAGQVLAGAVAAYASHTVVLVNAIKTVAVNTNYGVKLICSTASIDGDIKRRV